MVFILFFGITFQATPYAYASEVLPTRTRAKGMALGLFCAQGITIMFTQCAPLAVAAITWRFTIIFIGCNLFFLPITIWYFPETARKSLEEINFVFGEKVAVRLEDITDQDAHKETGFTDGKAYTSKNETVEYAAQEVEMVEDELGSIRVCMQVSLGKYDCFY